MNPVQKFINDQQKMLDRGIVATPTEDVLEAFAKANNGTNDFLLMQMAKNFGYQLALNHLTEQL